MPDIFTKNGKFDVIEYGENCSSFPFMDKLKIKIQTLLSKKQPQGK